MSQAPAMRRAWAAYKCKPDKMEVIDFGPDRIRVAPPGIEAWRALEQVLRAFDYDVRVEDTDSYACRPMKDGSAPSLHSYGIALDINWQTNPWQDHPGSRPPRFSPADTQARRAQDVKLGRADTDMTRAMVDAALAIRTKGGKPVFGWGGDWKTVKDSMHFQIEATPQDLAAGIDWTTVVGGTADHHDEDHHDIVVTHDDLDDGQQGPDHDDAAAFNLRQEGTDMGFSRKIFFDSVRGPLFGGSLTQSAVDNMNIVLDYWQANHRSKPRAQLAYILATMRHEVGAAMKPVRERFASSDAQARRALAGAAYGGSAGPFGNAYYGRGYVQLTWIKNYQKQGRKLGLNLVQNPDLVLQPGVAVKVLVEGMLDGDFTGKSLDDYITGSRQDFVNARRIVNKLDRAELIAGYARRFLRAIDAASDGDDDVVIVDDDDTSPVIDHDDGHSPVLGGDDDGLMLDDRLRLLVDRLEVLLPQLQRDGKLDPKIAQLLPLVSLLLGSNGKIDASQLVAAIGTSGLGAKIDPKVSQLLPLIALLLGNGDGKIDTTKLLTALGATETAVNPAAMKMGPEGEDVPNDKLLTPVNNAFGETIGKLLNGRKTGIGILGTLAGYLLGGTTGTPTFDVANAGSVLGPLLQVLGLHSPTIMAIMAALSAWGVLGKVDKWMAK